MAIRFPSIEARLGLGIGLDMPWGPGGLVHDRERGDVVSSQVHAFFAGEGAHASHVFFSWQPRDRTRPRLADYAAAWDDLWSAAPPGSVRALHHTALDLGAPDNYRRGGLFEFTNALVERYRLRWINEDLGIWSLGGKPLPYPLPPCLTTAGLRSAVAAVRECQAALAAPLVVEFPGFARGVSLPLGNWHAYDYLRVLAEETESPVTLDVGHLLSWQWLRGKRGEDLFAELERLPLAHCFEIHLSGCEIAGDRFIDAHHGVLLAGQLELLERLLRVCPNLHAITYEDPKLDAAGCLVASNRDSFARLDAIVRAWSSTVVPVPPVVHEGPAHVAALHHGDGEPALEVLGDALYDVLFRADARVALRAGDTSRFGDAARLIDTVDRDELDEIASMIAELVVRRTHRGSGGLASWYPQTIDAWQTANLGADLTWLAAQFLSSPACEAWRESADDQIGISLEEAFFRFAEVTGIGDARVRRREYLAAIARTLAVCPEPAFAVPAELRRCPGGWYAIADEDTPAPVLHAALPAGYVSGGLTPLLVDVLEGSPHGDEAVIAQARLMLMRLGLLGAGQSSEVL